MNTPKSLCGFCGNKQNFSNPESQVNLTSLSLTRISLKSHAKIFEDSQRGLQFAFSLMLD